MQNDLISRSALLRRVPANRKATGKTAWDYGVLYMEDAIKNAPAVDAVEVVRCTDCKFAYINSFSAAAGVAVCRKLSTEAGTAIRNHDDFCSYGERKAENG